MDGAFIEVRQETVNAGDSIGQTQIPKNGIAYTPSLMPHRIRTSVVVLGLEFGQCLMKIYRCLRYPRTITFPRTVRFVKGETFYGAESLQSAVLNEGLEVLGCDPNPRPGRPYNPVFAMSGLEKVRIPSTLKAIEGRTFFKCEKLRSVHFSEGLKKIRFSAFMGSGIESVVLPESTETVSGYAFARCKSLRSVKLNKGLDGLGANDYCNGLLYFGHAFDGSALTSITLPPNVKVLKGDTFYRCKCLKSIVFPADSKLEKIERTCFMDSALEELCTPKSLREIHNGAFAECGQLRKVTLNHGLEILGTNSEYSGNDFGVFQDCPIEELTIPSTVVSLNKNAFMECN